MTVIEERLAQLLQMQKEHMPTAESQLMVKRLSKLILRAGKRSRPQLLLLTYEAYRGTNLPMLIDVAVALELQHQFLLVHDDIMDNDTIRYDGPNITGYYLQDFPAKDSDIAVSMALMAGNLVFSFACQMILDHPTLEPEQKVAVLALIQETNIGVQAGQQLDIVNVLALNPDIDEEKLLLTDYLKTALYSVRLPMQVAAELLHLDQPERQKIDDFSRTFGIFYQLVDDYSDYFTNNSSFNNHPKYRDYKQGKITYPLLTGFKKASATDIKFLKKYAGQKNISNETMQQVVAILEKCGAQANAKKQIDMYYAQTLQSLDLLAINDEARVNFKTLLDSFQL